MYEKANEYAKADDAVKASKQSAGSWKPKKDNNHGASRSGTNHKDRKRKPEDLVSTTSNFQHQWPRLNTYDEIMNDPCTYHPNSKHAAKDCFIYKQFAEQYDAQSKKPTDGEAGMSTRKKDDAELGQRRFSGP